MPRLFVKYLQGNNLYTCKYCGNHLTTLSSLIAKSFRGQSGTAFLFNQVINIKLGDDKKCNLATGVHQIRNIFCLGCKNNKPIGWKYIKAYQQSQKYKQDKYILELSYLRTYSWNDFIQAQQNS